MQKSIDLFRKERLFTLNVSVINSTSDEIVGLQKRLRNFVSKSFALTASDEDDQI